MASIRRTLSPVPRGSPRVNGEACIVASPLSKSSSFAQGNLQPGGLPSSSFNSLEYTLYRIHTFVLGFFSHRLSRPQERSRQRGEVWRKPLLHVVVCFLVGGFLGLTFSPTNLSGSHMPQRQTMIPSVTRYHSIRPLMTSANNGNASLPEKWDAHNNALPEKDQPKRELVSDKNFDDHSVSTRKLLIIVTPTLPRPFQAYYLNRLAHTLKLVQPPLLWIVVEMNTQSEETADILRKSSVMYRHLVCSENVTGVKQQYAQQRNAALSHIETHHLGGIVYFADENNVYSIELFEHIREISGLGIWMVAKLSPTGILLEGPVCNGTEVIGWKTNEMARRFHADISGFAFNSTMLWDSNIWHRPALEPVRHLDTVIENFMVSTFIEQLAQDEAQMEGLLQGCSSIKVWHLPIGSSLRSYPHQWFLGRNLDSTAPLG